MADSGGQLSCPLGMLDLLQIWNDNNSEAKGEVRAGSPTVATGLSLVSLQVHSGGFFT